MMGCRRSLAGLGAEAGAGAGREREGKRRTSKALAAAAHRPGLQGNTGGGRSALCVCDGISLGSRVYYRISIAWLCCVVGIKPATFVPC